MSYLGEPSPNQPKDIGLKIPPHIFLGMMADYQRVTMANPQCETPLFGVIIGSVSPASVMKVNQTFLLPRLEMIEVEKLLSHAEEMTKVLSGNQCSDSSSSSNFHVLGVFSFDNEIRAHHVKVHNEFWKNFKSPFIATPRLPLPILMLVDPMASNNELFPKCFIMSGELFSPIPAEIHMNSRLLKALVHLMNRAQRSPDICVSVPRGAIAPPSPDSLKESLEERLKILRQFCKDSPNHHLTSEIQEALKTLGNIPDAAFPEDYLSAYMVQLKQNEDSIARHLVT